VRKFVRETMARGRESLGEMIKQGQERGEIRPDSKPADLAMTFQRNVIGTLLLWAMQSDNDLDAWLERTFRDFWAAAENRAVSTEQLALVPKRNGRSGPRIIEKPKAKESRSKSQ